MSFNPSQYYIKRIYKFSLCSLLSYYSSPRQAKATARTWHHQWVVVRVRVVAGVEQGSCDWRGQNPHDTRGKIISVDCLTLKALPEAKFRTLAMPGHLLRQAQLQLTFQIHSILPLFLPIFSSPFSGHQQDGNWLCLASCQSQTHPLCVSLNAQIENTPKSDVLWGRKGICGEIMCLCSKQWLLIMET